jgi:spore coat protein U-like protein
MRKQLSLILAGGLTLLSGAAHAGTTTSSFGVQLTINANCIINSTQTMDFLSAGVITANIDKFADMFIQCTNTTPFKIGLNAGLGVGATVAVRKMTGPGGATINYSLYQDAAYTTIWGNTPPTDTVNPTGTGASVQFRVYGRVPPQTTPAPGAYTDTITVTVTY